VDAEKHVVEVPLSVGPLEHVLRVAEGSDTLGLSSHGVQNILRTALQSDSIARVFIIAATNPKSTGKPLDAKDRKNGPEKAAKEDGVEHSGKGSDDRADDDFDLNRI